MSEINNDRTAYNHLQYFWFDKETNQGSYLWNRHDKPTVGIRRGWMFSDYAVDLCCVSLSPNPLVYPIYVAGVSVGGSISLHAFAVVSFHHSHKSIAYASDIHDDDLINFNYVWWQFLRT